MNKAQKDNNWHGGDEHTPPPITPLEFQADDFEKAEHIARSLGYDQTAYTSTSALWGLFCLRSRPTQRAGCIIKTREFGLLFVQDVDDLNLEGAS